MHGVSFLTLSNISSRMRCGPRDRSLHLSASYRVFWRREDLHGQLLQVRITIKSLLRQKPRENYVLTVNGLPSDSAALLPERCRHRPPQQRRCHRSSSLFPELPSEEALFQSEQSCFSATRLGRV